MAKAPSKKSPPRKGASRNNKPAARKNSGGVPGWLWLLLGLAFGLFGAFLWHLWELRAESSKQETAASALSAPEKDSETKSKALANTPASANKDQGEEPRFDFYTLLPQQEVMPGKNSEAPTAANSGKKAPVSSYSLQAGSFKNEAEADKRRASILMLGLPVKVQKVPGTGSETWYRVLVGPFEGKEAAQQARSNLKANGVETLPAKQG